jgi:DNA-binding protein HU-beta
MAEATRMTQTQIVKELAESTGVGNKVAKQFIEKFAELAVRETKKKGVFVLPGIGRLVRVERKARTGAIPRLANRSRYRPRRS